MSENMLSGLTFKEIYTSTEDKLPRSPAFFLFPGILGNGSELSGLARELRKTFPDKGIFYMDQTLPASSENKEMTLAEQVQELTDRIVEYPPPFKACPIYFIGYSHGVKNAIEVANQVVQKNKDFDIHFIFLDGVSVEVANWYAINRRQSFTRDLLSVFKYAAKLSRFPGFKDLSLDETQPNLDEAQLKTYCSLSTKEMIEKMADWFIDEQKDLPVELNNKFNNFKKNAKQNLLVIENSNKSHQVFPFANINLLWLDETAEKYKEQTNFGGWEPYAQKVTLINCSYLQRQAHVDLLSNSTNITQLINVIVDIVNRETPKTKFILDELHNVLNEFKTRFPKINTENILQTLDCNFSTYSNFSSLFRINVDQETINDVEILGSKYRQWFPKVEPDKMTASEINHARLTRLNNLIHQLSTSTIEKICYNHLSNLLENSRKENNEIKFSQLIKNEIEQQKQESKKENLFWNLFARKTRSHELNTVPMTREVSPVRAGKNV